jgi:hypothetical protein
VEKGRRFWSGLSGQQKVIAGIAAVFVAIAAIMVPVFAFGHGAHQSPSPTGPAGSHTGQSPSPTGRAGSHTGSQYYQWGYESAISGTARQNYMDLLCTGYYGCHEPDPSDVKQACKEGFQTDANVPVEMRIADPDTDAYRANKDDFVKGCGDAFRDHPPSLTSTAPTLPRH